MSKFHSHKRTLDRNGGQRGAESGDASPQSAAGCGGSTRLAEELSAVLDAYMKSWFEKQQPVQEPTSSVDLSGTLSGIDQKLSQLSEMYHLMNEYRNQCSVLRSKLAEFYERIALLELFCTDTFTADDDQHRSLLKRTSNTELKCRKILNTVGMEPIFPHRNDEVDSALHEIIMEVDAASPEDRVGAVSECTRMGLIRDGVVVKAAQVVVYK